MIRAACHLHSDWSYDGKWSIAELAEEFRRRKYRVLMMTDHDRGFTEERRQQHRAACAAASTDDLFVLPGIEYSDAANRVHILVWGDVPFVGENVATGDLLSAVSAAQGVAVLAHPRRRKAWEIFDPAWAGSLLGIEVWNRKTDGWAPSEPAAKLLEKTSLVPFVGMDFHDRRQFFPLAIDLDLTEPVSEASILACLRHKRCNPRFFGRPLPAFATGWWAATLGTAEFGRRTAAHAYRAMRKRRSS